MSSERAAGAGHYENMNGKFTPAQIREFERRGLERQRVSVLADLLGGVARDPEQAEYEEYLRNCQERGAEASKSQQSSVRITPNLDLNV
jgi:hypothetical protein